MLEEKMPLFRCFDRSFTLGQMLFWLWSVLVLLLLGAHFYRASEYGIVLCIVGMLALFCSKKVWTRWAAALFLLWGMLEWTSSACLLAQTRLMMGMPWMRGAIILCTVAVLTGMTGFALARQVLHRADEERNAILRGTVFMAVFLCLFYLRTFVSLNLLLLERFFPVLGAVEIFFAAWYGSFAAGLLADPKRSRKVRQRLWLVFACAFFLQFALGVLGVGQMLLTGKLHVPVPAFILYGPLFRGELNIMPFIVLASTLLAGSAWCSMLCYFGPFDALASQGRAVHPLPPFLNALLRWGRPAVLVTGTALTLILKSVGIALSSAIALSIAYAVLSLLAMAALSRRWGGMLHCTTLCPIGLIVSLLGRLSPWRLRVDKAVCDDCGACEKLCRWRAITPESRAKGGALARCSLCRDCVGVCRKKALSVRCAGLPAELSGKLFCGILATLHALFLAVAMV